jgi:hypothetical protein
MNIADLNQRDSFETLSSLLFPSSAEGLLETRSIERDTGKVEQNFWPIPVTCIPLNYIKTKRTGWEHYFSVAPRVRSSGTKADVEWVHTVGWTSIRTTATSDWPNSGLSRPQLSAQVRPATATPIGHSRSPQTWPQSSGSTAPWRPASAAILHAWTARGLCGCRAPSTTRRS